VGIAGNAHYRYFPHPPAIAVVGSSNPMPVRGTGGASRAFTTVIVVQCDSLPLRVTSGKSCTTGATVELLVVFCDPKPLLDTGEKSCTTGAIVVVLHLVQYRYEVPVENHLPLQS